ncbi:MAG: cbb3-type cytochrome c oxidase subunit 3 [Rickettsiales bacterium]|nr:cbb3-type cytochrome c oxidase subunit 3 [Rickettsiales bacterium]
MSWFIAAAPTLGLLFFFVVFVGIAFLTYRPSAKAKLENYSLIPLKDDIHE